MIIECVNCKKKFNVDSSLIPVSGRKIQCGACNHTWFYKNADTGNDKIKDNKTSKSNQENEDNYLINPNIPQENVKIDINQLDIKDSPESSHNDVLKNDNKPSKKNITNFSKFPSYLTVIIISLIAIIFLLDTFKLVLSVIFPNLELILFNLFEVLKDIYLFGKNLFF